MPHDVVARAALPLYGMTTEGQLGEEALWNRLEAAPVLCLGERHDSAPHHWAQQQVLLRLAKRAKQQGHALAVGLEMFQFPFQGALARYARGELDEAELLAQTEYATRWGFDFSLYRPLLEVARDFQLPTLALNAPREITRTVGRGGLEALTTEQRAALPQLDLRDAAHYAYFEKAVGSHPMPAGGPTVEDMYTAQVIWDESMAEHAAGWLEQQAPRAQMVILAGSGHCHRSAVPARLARRTGLQVLSVNPVLASDRPRPDTEPDRSNLYDLWLVLTDEPPGT